MSKPKLRPCPFCSKAAGLYRSCYDERRICPECTDCSCALDDFLTEGLAADAWNHRPIEDALLAACETIEKWLLEGEMEKHYGAPAWIFQVREALARARGEVTP